MIEIVRPASMTLQEQNAWFTTLSPAQQRVVIAQDVLEALEQKHLIPESGVYVKPVRAINFTPGHLQQELCREVCEVCGKGALLAARVRGYNHYELSYPRAQLGNTAVCDGLEGIFEVEVLDRIECAFEGWTNDPKNPEEPGNWYAKLPLDERMRGIMQNLIDHDGDFVMPEGIGA